jgi:hypothetical protein
MEPLAQRLQSIGGSGTIQKFSSSAFWLARPWRRPISRRHRFGRPSKAAVRRSLLRPSLAMLAAEAS